MQKKQFFSLGSNLIASGENKHQKKGAYSEMGEVMKKYGLFVFFPCFRLSFSSLLLWVGCEAFASPKPHFDPLPWMRLYPEWHIYLLPPFLRHSTCWLQVSGATSAIASANRSGFSSSIVFHFESCSIEKLTIDYWTQCMWGANWPWSWLLYQIPYSLVLHTDKVYFFFAVFSSLQLGASTYFF